jgi:carboxypeptidase PM20D1
MVRLIIAAVAVVLSVLAAIVGYRTATFTASAAPASVEVPDTAAYAVDVDAAAAHLAEAIRFPTVSLVSPDDDRAPFVNFHAWMQRTYPAFHAVATRETIGEFSLLYTWAGSDPAQPPMLLLAHQDVVPTPADTLDAWSVDPFAGIIEDGAVWGRGAIDDKGSLVAMLEALEALAREGRQPTRTILIAFGHDEEIGGTAGAAMIAQALAQRGVRAWFVLDEGMAAIETHPLTGRPATLIGIGERGFANLAVRAHGQPGHSSTPPPETAVSLVAEAVDRIHAMPIERRLEGGPAIDMMRALAPDLSFTTRMAVANEWLFGGLLRGQVADSPAALALLGTTAAPTMIEGGVRPNVLPGEASAIINFRVHPRDTLEGLLARARAAAGEHEGVVVEWDGRPLAATPVSSTTSASYALVAALAGATMPQARVAPALVLAGTDSRNYSEVAQDVYRFQPMSFTDADLERIHGINERLTLENLERSVRFYRGLLEAGAMQ